MRRPTFIELSIIDAVVPRMIVCLTAIKFYLNGERRAFESCISLHGLQNIGNGIDEPNLYQKASTP